MGERIETETVSEEWGVWQECSGIVQCAVWWVAGN